MNLRSDEYALLVNMYKYICNSDFREKLTSFYTA